MFRTSRLYIKKAELNKQDINFLVKLHNNPEVMKYVGFPKGLGTTFENEKKLTEKNYNTDNARLLIYKKDNDVCIGACKVGIPNKEGFCEVDYKLFPEFWGNGFGSEILKGLANYIFEVKKYKGIQTTPNQKNVASQKMCEKIGMKKVEEGIFKAPKEKRNMIDVPYFVYRITKDKYSKLWKTQVDGFILKDEEDEGENDEKEKNF